MTWVRDWCIACVCTLIIMGWAFAPDRVGQTAAVIVKAFNAEMQR